MESRMKTWLALLPLLSMGLLTLMTSLDIGLVGEADGLTITGSVTWTTDRTFDEDVIVESGGRLTIVPGVVVEMELGHRLIVNDGTLVIRGQRDRLVHLTWASPGDKWGGIETDEDSLIVIYHANIQYATTGLEVLGTGHAGTARTISVNDTFFHYCDNGVMLDGNGQTGPFGCTFENNDIEGGDRGLSLEGNYSGVTVENSVFQSNDEIGVYSSGCSDNRYLNNTISNARYGIQIGMMDNGRTQIENNTIWDAKIGLFGAFISTPTLIRNNSLFCSERGIYMGLMNSVLIENNTITVSGDNNNMYPVEISSGAPPTVVKDNIISDCTTTMMVNGSAANHTIYNNLLLNLTDSGFVDSDGDGFCDSEPLIPGSAGSYARNCRTSVVHMGDGAPSTTYVNPGQAAMYAPSGSRLKMISNPQGYGPKSLESRMIFHTEMPVITRPMHFIGEEMDMIYFIPGVCMDSPLIRNTHHAGIENVTVDDGMYPARVENSHNITLKNIDMWANRDDHFRGFDIDDSVDVTIENSMISYAWDFCVNISGSSRVRLSDIIIQFPEKLGIYVEDSQDIRIDDATTLFSSRSFLLARRSTVHVDGSNFGTGQGNAVDMIECPGSSVSGSRIVTGHDNRVAIRMVDCPGTKLHDNWMSVINSTVNHAQILFEGDSKDIVIDDCFIYGDTAGPESEVLILVRGNFSGSRINDSTLWGSTTGIEIRDPGYSERFTDIEITNTRTGHNQLAGLFQFEGDVLVENCTIEDGDYGLLTVGAHLQMNQVEIGNMVNYAVHSDSHGGLPSDLTITNSNIRNASMGIRDISVDDVDLVTVLENVTVSNTDYALSSHKNRVMIRDSNLSGDIASLYMVDTNGSRIEDTILHGDTPVSMDRMPSSGPNRITLVNCTGKYEGSEMVSSLCEAIWKWPLDVHVTDEVSQALEARLTIDSGTYGEVLNETIDGFRRVNLSGYHAGGTGLVGPYQVRVSESGLFHGEEVIILGWQELFFMINHHPAVTYSALDEIVFDEDGNRSEDLSGWFTDRDEITVSMESFSPAEIVPSLVGTDLTVRAEEDWNGEGEIQLNVTDTFGASIFHNVTIRVNPVNDAPYLSEPLPVVNTTEDGSVWINLSEYASDVDSSDLVWTNLSTGNLSLEWDLQMTNLTIIPDPNWFGSMNITLLVSDGEKELETDLTVNVAPVNDPPVWNGDPVVDISVEAGSPHRHTISDMVSDVDNVWSDMVITFDSANVSMDGGDIVLLYPEDTENMTETVIVTISDGTSSTSFELNVSVTEQGDAGDGSDIIDAEVSVDEETGDWNVVVEGSEDQEVHIVIEGVGSYKLEETESGHHEVTISGDQFTEGETYDYHFSDTSGGEDITDGQFTGSVVQPVIDDDGDGEDGTDEDDDTSPWIPVLVIILIIIVLVVVYFMVKGRKDDGFMEE